MIFEQGRLCMKIAGREAGKYCVIVEKKDDNFVVVSGPKSITRVKRRACNIVHLEPLQDKFKISSGSDEELERLWKESGMIEKLGIKIPEKKKVREKPKEEAPAKVRKPKAEPKK